MPTQPAVQCVPDLSVRWDSSGQLNVKDFQSGASLEVRREVPAMLRLLHALQRPTTLAAAAKATGIPPKRVAVMVKTLRTAGLLKGEAPKQDIYKALYSGLDIHRLMVMDHARTQAFRDGIQVAVQPGDVVLDVGCGSGVLSMFAVKAGARHVYAVDRADIVELARQNAARNGMQDRITFLRGDVETISLPEKVDVIVSEWLGHFVIIENMLDSVITARDRWLKRGGRMLPSRVELLMAPAADVTSRRALLECWNRNLYGLDFTAMQEAAMQQAEPRIVDPSCLLATAQPVHAWDMKKEKPGSMLFSGKASFTMERPGVLDSMCCHFTVDLAPGVMLDTAPGLMPTHWLQHHFPLPCVDVRKGDVLETRLVSEASPYPRRPDVGLEWRLLRQGALVTHGQHRYT